MVSAATAPDREGRIEPSGAPDRPATRELSSSSDSSTVLAGSTSARTPVVHEGPAKKTFLVAPGASDATMRVPTTSPSTAKPDTDAGGRAVAPVHDLHRVANGPRRDPSARDAANPEVGKQPAAGGRRATAFRAARISCAPCCTSETSRPRGRTPPRASSSTRWRHRQAADSGAGLLPHAQSRCLDARGTCAGPRALRSWKRIHIRSVPATRRMALRKVTNRCGGVSPLEHSSTRTFDRPAPLAAGAGTAATGRPTASNRDQSRLRARKRMRQMNSTLREKLR